jgi:hypothetical protein
MVVLDVPLALESGMSSRLYFSSFTAGILTCRKQYDQDERGPNQFSQASPVYSAWQLECTPQIYHTLLP